MACGGQDDISIIREKNDRELDRICSKYSFENGTALKRKCNPNEETKPNFPVRRKLNDNEYQNSNSRIGSNQEKLMHHLREHIIVRRDGDDFDDCSNESLNPPQQYMEPVIPPTERFGLDLTPTLQNVVSTVNMGCTLDLRRITFCTRMSEYNPARFSGVVMRIREPHTTALIFRSGKMVVTGAKTEGEAHLASRKYARIIQKLGFNVLFMDFKIQNIVGTFDVKFPVRVEDLNQVHGQFCRYEPELFPGLIYRLVKPRVVLLIFVNGKIVLTGARNRSELKEALQIMYPVLKSFKKDKSP